LIYIYSLVASLVLNGRDGGYPARQCARTVLCRAQGPHIQLGPVGHARGGIFLVRHPRSRSRAFNTAKPIAANVRSLSPRHLPLPIPSKPSPHIFGFYERPSSLLSTRQTPGSTHLGFVTCVRISSGMRTHIFLFSCLCACPRPCPSYLHVRHQPLGIVTGRVNPHGYGFGSG
jgi:hypothetical protein